MFKLSKCDAFIRLKYVFTEDCREINLDPFGISSKCTQVRANSKYLVLMNLKAYWTRFFILDPRKTSGSNSPLCYFDVTTICFSIFWLNFRSTWIFFVMKIARFLLRSNGSRWMKLNWSAFACFLIVAIVLLLWLIFYRIRQLKKPKERHRADHSQMAIELPGVSPWAKKFIKH